MPLNLDHIAVQVPAMIEDNKVTITGIREAVSKVMATMAGRAAD